MYMIILSVQNSVMEKEIFSSNSGPQFLILKITAHLKSMSGHLWACLLIHNDQTHTHTHFWWFCPCFVFMQKVYIFVPCFSHLSLQSHSELLHMATH